MECRLCRTTLDYYTGRLWGHSVHFQSTLAGMGRAIFPSGRKFGCSSKNGQIRNRRGRDISRANFACIAFVLKGFVMGQNFLCFFKFCNYVSLYEWKSVKKIYSAFMFNGGFLYDRVFFYLAENWSKRPENLLWFCQHWKEKWASEADKLRQREVIFIEETRLRYFLFHLTEYLQWVEQEELSVIIGQFSLSKDV